MAIDTNEPAGETRYLRINDLTGRLPISRPTIYRLAKKGQFPKPVKFGGSSVWIEREISDWELAQQKART